MLRELSRGLSKTTSNAEGCFSHVQESTRCSPMLEVAQQESLGLCPLPEVIHRQIELHSAVREGSGKHWSPFNQQVKGTPHALRQLSTPCGQRPLEPSPVLALPEVDRACAGSARRAGSYEAYEPGMQAPAEVGQSFRALSCRRTAQALYVLALYRSRQPGIDTAKVLGLRIAPWVPAVHCCLWVQKAHVCVTGAHAPASRSRASMFALPRPVRAACGPGTFWVGSSIPQRPCARAPSPGGRSCVRLIAGVTPLVLGEILRLKHLLRATPCCSDQAPEGGSMYL